jgi:hypothetical protein
MNLIQTINLFGINNPFENAFGWRKPEYHLMSWALSSLQLKANYNNITLYANDAGAKLLIDALELPYTNIFLSHTDLKGIDKNLWALPKLYTYSLQEEPFLHIDGDVFLFGKLPDRLFNAELIAQNMEEATHYYTSTQLQIIDHFTYFPNCVKIDFESHIPIRAVNAGILGGSNIEFIKEYCSQAFRYVSNNAQHLSKIDADRFNVFFEQHLFYSLAKERNLLISLLFEDLVKDNEYKYLGNFHETPFKLKYLHLLGHFKKDENTCIQMAAKLRELYPEYYYRIIHLCKKNGVQLSNRMYMEKDYFTVTDYIYNSQKARGTYNKNKTSIINGSNLTQTDVGSAPELKLPARFIENINPGAGNEIDETDLKNDLKKFTAGLQFVVDANTKFSGEYLYGRDLESERWYGSLFSDEDNIENKMICLCDEVTIIESVFDWAGLVNKHNRVGVGYYENLELVAGRFYNMVVAEVINSGFSLHDLDEMEKLILENLTEPATVNEMLNKLKVYVEEEVIENHYDEYKELVITMLKQLVLKKAIKPFNNIQLN